MKKLITTDATATRAIPIQSKTVKYLQDSYTEMTVSLAKGIIGVSYNPSLHYAVMGCINYGTGSTYDISEGLILSGNTLYYVPASGIFTVAGANVPVCTITTTYLSGVDPVTFIGTTNSYNIHEDKRIIIAGGASGSGTFDYSSLIRCQDKIHYIGATDEPAFLAGWANSLVSAADVLSFVKEGNKVTLRGSCSCAGGAGVNVFILPTGYYPTTGDIYFNAFDVTNNTIETLIIDGAGAGIGTVSIPTIGGGGVNIYIDITFYV